MTASFGSDVERPLVDVWGLAAAPAGVLVYDAGATRVWELDRDLEPKGQYGREGPGPGEFRYQRVNHGDWLTADDSSFFVLQFKGISQFQTGSGFLRLVSGPVEYIETVDAIEVFNGGLVYGSDRIDRGTGERALQFWSVPLDGEGKPELWRVDTMPKLPGSRGQFVRGVFVAQGEPLWGASDSCLFVSDGSGLWLLRVESGATTLADTIPLPALSPPEPTRDDERQLARLRARAAAVGINVGPDGLEPTAPARWSSMSVDPDGFVWIELWSHLASRNGPRRVVVINPGTGENHEIAVPRFPDAFLDDGSFVSLSFHSELGVPVLEKFSLDGDPTQE